MQIDREGRSTAPKVGLVHNSHALSTYAALSRWTHKVAYLALALALSVGFLLFFFGTELFSVLLGYLGVWGAPVRVEVAPLADVPRDDHVVAQQQDPVQVHRAPRHPQQQVLARVRPQQRHLQSKFYIDLQDTEIIMAHGFWYVVW